MKKKVDAAEARMLEEQLDAYRRGKTLAMHVEAAHAAARSLDEVAFYPEHDKRTASSAYRRLHDHLTRKLDLPCLVCGVRQSTLGDAKQNPFGAKQMETHHHLVEWALAGAISAKKFNAAVRPHLARRRPDEPLYRRRMTAKEVSDWVDHSEDNLWVLCDVHHRARYFGVHEISFPVWVPQGLLRDDFESYARRHLAVSASQRGVTARHSSRARAGLLTRSST